jgi:hypothetical protein
MTVSDNYVHPWDRPDEYDPDCPQVVTTPEQVLTGLPLGRATLEALCDTCGTSMGEGADVFVYAYRAAEAPRWSLAGCYCATCAPSGIRKPTLGTTEVLVGAQLAVVSLPREQRHSLCVSTPTLRSFSPPTRGSAP